MAWIAGGIILLYAFWLATGLRGEGVSKTVKMLAAWIAIFAAAFLFFVYVDVDDVKQRVSAELTRSAIVEEDGTVRIPMSQDGHFWVEASVNGEPVEFLVDTGATITTIDRKSASRAGLEMLEGRSAMVQTANGTVRVDVGRAGTLAIGPIVERGLVVQVSAIEDVNVLGMNFLSSLESWRVEQGKWLVLER